MWLSQIFNDNLDLKRCTRRLGDQWIWQINLPSGRGSNLVQQLLTKECSTRLQLLTLSSSKEVMKQRLDQPTASVQLLDYYVTVVKTSVFLVACSKRTIILLSTYTMVYRKNGDHTKLDAQFSFAISPEAKKVVFRKCMYVRSVQSTYLNQIQTKHVGTINYSENRPTK